MRLLYVVQQNTGLPLFFRYIAGNIIDATTIETTVAELKASGIDTKFAILDADYYNGKNADVLMDAGISFISQMHGNFKVYKEVMEKHRGILEHEENRPAYAYLCLDCTMKREEEYKLSQKVADTAMNSTEIHNRRNKHGIFMLISNRRIAKENLLPLYYARNRVEDIFKLCKGNCSYCSQPIFRKGCKR